MSGDSERLKALEDRVDKLINLLTSLRPSEKQLRGLFSDPSTHRVYLFKPQDGADILIYWELAARLRPAKPWNSTLVCLGKRCLFDPDEDEAYRVSTLIAQHDPDGKTWLPLSADRRVYIQIPTLEWLACMRDRPKPSEDAL